MDEPGTSTCRSLIDAKRGLESVMASLNNVNDIDLIQAQLISIYNQLEALHDLQRNTLSKEY